MKFQKTKNKLEWDNEYEPYLKSDVWLEIRSQAIVRANNKCERCGSNLGKLDVHHITYDHIGGREKPEELQVLCYPCHQKADRIRTIKTDERRKNARYRARLEGYAARKYGDNLDIDFDVEEMEIEFITYLYKKYCIDNDFEYSPNFDPNTDLDFLEFWNDVLNGTQ